MRRWRAAFRIILAMLLLAVPGSVLGKVDEGRVVRVGVWEEPPYLFHDEQGKVVGLFADVLRHVAAESGWHLSFYTCEQACCLRMLALGELDLLAGDLLPMEGMRFGGEAIFDDWGQLYATGGAEIASILDLQGQRLAVQAGDAAAEEFIALLAANGITPSTLEVADEAALFTALEEGRADVGLVSRLYGARHIEAHPQVWATRLICCTHPLRFAAQVGMGDDLLSTLDAHLMRVKEDDHSYYYRSRTHWLGITRLPLQPIDPRYLLFLLLAFIAFVAILFVIVLRAQVRQRTAALEEEITRHRRTEQELRLSRLALQRRAQGLTLLSELADALHSSLDFREVTERAVLLVVRQTEFSACAIFTLLEEAGVLRVISHVGFSPSLERLAGDLPLDAPLSAAALKSGEVVVAPDLSREDRILPHVRDGLLSEGFRMLVIVPLVYRKEALGTLNLLAKKPHHVSDEERSMLMAAGRTIALAMANARYVERIEAEVSVRRKAELALVEERALLARRVVERTSDLRAANLELAQAIKAKDEFLANMSHEFRTPLNAILGISGALEEGTYGPLTEDQRHALHSIIDSARHLLSLINDILDLSKMGAGKFSLDIGPVEVKALCESSIQMVRQIALAKNVQLHFDYDTRVQLIQADGRSIRQVLVNLLGNAVKFTPPGGSVGLEVRGDPEAQVVRFIVWDTGIGIDPATMQRLFHPFEQGEKGLMREYGGTGLGLALVHRMVELHSGSIAVESHRGEGSRFIVTLAWQEGADATSVTGYNLETTPPLQLPFHRLFYLTGERAEGETAVALRNMVEEWGMLLTVHSLLDDAEALERRLDPLPDLLLVDLEEAGVEEMWRFLRQVLIPHLQGSRPPLLIVSAENSLLKTLPLPVDGWLVKPLSRSQLLQAFLRILIARTVREVAVETERLPQSVKVLVVESGEMLLTMLQDYFHFRGYIVYSASDGEAALHLAREELPDIIIISLQLEGMSSLETIRRIRRYPALQRIPIIALTSLSLQGDRERCLQAGVTAYLLRPVSFQRLEQLMMRLLDEVERGQEDTDGRTA